MVACICAVPRTTVADDSTRRNPSDGNSTWSSTSAAMVSTQPCVPRMNEKPCTPPIGTFTTRIGASG
jgi:hypothetical protein